MVPELAAVIQQTHILIGFANVGWMQTKMILLILNNFVIYFKLIYFLVLQP